jgi:streptogramin lyase
MKSWHLLPILLIAFMPSLSSCLATTPEIPAPSRLATPPEVLVDCIWQAELGAWIDENGNGSWDSEESPLENVLFYIETAPRDSFKDEAVSGVSDSRGTCKVDWFLAGCPKESYWIYAQPPPSYELTSPTGVKTSTEELGKRLLFGFRYLPGVPPPTSRPSMPITCDLVLDSGWARPTDIAVAPDGAVWVAGGGGKVVRLAPGTLFRTEYGPADGIPATVVRGIVTASDGTVWIGTDGGAARWDGSVWTTYTTVHGLANNVVEDIAVALDGTVWFSTWGGISSFNPKTNVWRTEAIEPEKMSSSYSGVAIRAALDGSVWFISFTGIYQMIPAGSGHHPTWIVYKRDENDEFCGLHSILQEATLLDESLWLVSRPGDGLSRVVRFNPRTGAQVTYSYYTTGGAMIGGVPYSLARAEDGSLWIGTRGEGLVHFIPETADGISGTWVHYTAENGLYSNNILLVVAAPDGALWYIDEDGGIQQSVVRCAVP